MDDNEVPLKTSGSSKCQKHSSSSKSVVGQVSDESQITMAKHKLVADELPVSEQVAIVAAFEERSLTKIGSEQTVPGLSKRNDQLPETTAARLSTITRIPCPRLNRSYPDVCSLSESKRHMDDNQLTSASYTVGEQRKTKTAEASERCNALQLRKVTNSTDSRLPSVKTTKISAKKSAVASEAKEPAAKSRTRREPTRKKRLIGHSAEDRKNGRRQPRASQEAASETICDDDVVTAPLQFVALSGRHVPIDFRFAERGDTRRRSPGLSVTFADKDERSASTGGSVSAAQHSWQDAAVNMSPPIQQNCCVLTTTAPEVPPETVNILYTSEFQSAAVPIEKQIDVETCPVKVAKAHLIESSDTLYTSEDLAVTEQTTMSCNNIKVLDDEQQAHSDRDVLTATPSFLLGVTPPPPSFDDYHKKRPSDSHSVELAASFISYSASDKSLTKTQVRQKNSADKPPIRREISAAKDLASTAVNSEKQTSNCSSKNNLSTVHDCRSPLIRQNINRNKPSSTPETKSISELKPKTLRNSNITSERVKTSTSADRIKRSSVTPNVAEKSRKKDIYARNIHKRKEPVKSRIKAGQARKNTIDNGVRIFRMNYASHQFNQAGELSTKSRNVVKNTSVIDSKEVNKVEEMPFVPLVCSPHRSDEITNNSPKPVCFFISCPSVGRSGSHAATNTSRIPRSIVSTVSCPVKSYSYVLNSSAAIAPTKSCNKMSSERRSANDSQSSATANLDSGTELLNSISVNSVSDSRSLPREAQHIQTHSFSVDELRIASKDATPLDYIESHLFYPDVDNKKPVQPATENRPHDNVSLDTLSKSMCNVSNLTTRDLATAIHNVEDHFRPMSQMTIVTREPGPLSEQSYSIPSVKPNLEKLSKDISNNQLQSSSISPVKYTDAASCVTTEQLDSDDCQIQAKVDQLKADVQHSESQLADFLAAPIQKIPSEQSLKSQQLSYSSPFCIESNLEVLPVDLRNILSQCSSTVKKPSNERSLSVPSVIEMSNLMTQDQLAAATDNKEQYQSSRCTVLAAAASQQEQTLQWRQFPVSNYSSISTAEPNLEKLSVEMSNNQHHSTSICPVKHANSTDDKTAEKLLFLAKTDRKCLVEVEKSDADSDALKVSTTRQETKTSTTKVSCDKSTQIYDTMSSDTNRLRNFDEVSIELPGIVWSKLQSEEICHQEAVTACQSEVEALVLRSSLTLPLHSPSPTRPSHRAKMPSRLLATAQRRRHSVAPSEELSINVVCSRVDKAVQSADRDFQLRPSNCFDWKTSEGAKTTRSDYVSAKRYLDQLAADLTSSNQLRKCDTFLVSDLTQNEIVPVRHPDILDDVRNPHKSDTTDCAEQEDEEHVRFYEVEKQARRQTLPFKSTLLPNVKGQTNKNIDMNHDDQPCPKFLRSDFSSNIVQKNETRTMDSDDNELHADLALRGNKDGDGVVLLKEEFQVLATAERRRGGAEGEPCWQPSDDHLLVSQPPQLSSGALPTRNIELQLL